MRDLHVRIARNDLELLVQTLSTNDETPPKGLRRFRFPLLVDLVVSGVGAASASPAARKLFAHFHDL